MAAIKEVSYRTFDELLDSVRLDLSSFNSAGDIDAANLIKVAQRINWELGLRIRTMKETMLEVDHFKAKLPADFYQMNLALICHNYRHVQNAPWNGHVLLEQVVPSPTSPGTLPSPSGTVFCWTITLTENITCVPYTCSGSTSLGVQDANGNWSIKCFTSPGVSTICAQNVMSGFTPAGIACVIGPKDSIVKGLGCYVNPDGTYSCSPPTPTTTCDICNITHIGDCPELVTNPYPLGKTRSICNDTINIKILQYCESEVRCYEQFERLYIEPFIQADAFSRQGQFRDSRHEGRYHGSINGNFLEVPDMECTKVYINYLGGMEDDDGNLLVLDHPEINQYYTWAIKEVILENLYLNGEDMGQRVRYAHDKKEEYRYQALSISNMPNYRDCIKTIETIRRNHNRQYWHPLSRYYGRIGHAIRVDQL
jgi:hypothetical protein